MTDQMSLFPEQEDTPLFSGTPQRVTDSTYQPVDQETDTQLDMFVDGNQTIHGVYVNTRYIINRTGQPWGRITGTSKTQGLARVNTPLGVKEFGTYEIAAWIRDKIISPVCGICNKPVHGGHLDGHLQVFHTVKVHG